MSPPTCECGCGTTVREGRRFVQGHNLPNLNGRMPAGAWQPGAAPALKHGLRTREPSADALDPVLDAVVAELAPGLPAPLIDPATGDVAAWARETVWSLAVLKLIVVRCSRYLAQHGHEDERGRLRPEVEALGRATQRYRSALADEAMTLRSRIRANLDHTRTASVASAMSEPDPERRARLLREAGVDLDYIEEEPDHA